MSEQTVQIVSGDEKGLISTVANGIDTIVSTIESKVDSNSNVSPVLANIVDFFGGAAQVFVAIAPLIEDFIKKLSKNKKKKAFKAREPSPDRRALLVGMNYKGTQNALGGCIKDTTNVRNYLLGQGGFTQDQLVVLVDEATPFSTKPTVPTKANILKAFSELVAWAGQTLQKNPEAQPEIFFHYSGHGTNVADSNGDELDGQDECLVPRDFAKGNLLKDDEIFKALIQPLGKLSPNIKLVSVIDACRSGTVFDLPYLWTGAENYAVENKKLWTQSKKDPKTYQGLFGQVPQVLAVSGCKDNQFSTDLGNQGGALTSTLLSLLQKTPSLSWADLLTQARAILAKYNQVPELTTTEFFDLTETFGIVVLGSGSATDSSRSFDPYLFHFDSYAPEDLAKNSDNDSSPSEDEEETPSEPESEDESEEEVQAATAQAPVSAPVFDNSAQAVQVQDQDAFVAKLIAASGQKIDKIAIIVLK